MFVLARFFPWTVSGELFVATDQTIVPKEESVFWWVFSFLAISLRVILPDPFLPINFERARAVDLSEEDSGNTERSKDKGCESEPELPSGRSNT